MPTLRQQLDDLIDRLSPDLEKAFRAAIEQIKSDIVLREVVEKLERQDVDGAVQALHIDPTAFRPLTEALRQTFNAGGSLVVQNMPRLSDPLGGRVVLRWDIQNQGAEAVIRDLSSQLITNVSEGTKETARQVILNGYSQGQGPNTIALDIVGRKDPITKQRTGGILGLTSPQTATVEAAKVNLASGDPALMRKYLTLQTRDKRFDKTVNKAIRDGKPVDPDMLGKIIGALRDKNLKLRGETIARTETQSSVHAAKHEAYLQMLDKTGRDASLVTRTWRAVGDRHTRHSHMALNGTSVKGMDAPFVADNGDMMRYPGDRSLGAGARSLVNCRCHEDYSFDFAEAYARSRGR